MRYNDDEVLDILKQVTDNPEKVLDAWNLNQANTLLDLKKYQYSLFLYEFPVILNDETVASVTLAQFSNTGFDNLREKLMCKYLTPKDYEESWVSYSHDTYLHCYLTIHKEFILDKPYNLSFIDAAGKSINYSLYGLDDRYERPNDPQYWFDNRFCIDINDNFEGWSMGEKINEVITKRCSDNNTLENEKN